MGTLTIRRDEVDLATLVREDVDDVLRPSGVALSLSLPDADVTVHADADRLAQVVSNLVRNALDHGGEQVSVTLSTDADTAVLVIADDGPGVHDHVRDTLFERFSRGTDVDRHSRGMGLGLAVAHELTQAMGGSLVLAPSSPGVGAIFELRVPLAVTERAPVLAASG